MSPAIASHVSRRVLVIGPHDLISNALCSVLRDGRFDGDAVRGCDIRGDLEHMLGARRPDVVVFDIDHSHETWCGHSRLIRRSAPLRPTLVLSGVLNDVDHGAWLEAGAIGVVEKSAPLGSLFRALEHALDGLPLLEPAEHARLVQIADNDGLRQNSAESELARLSLAEREVLAALMGGRSVAELASDRVVSVTTIRSQVRSILTKLDVHSQVAAIAFGYRSGLQPT